MGAGRLMPRLGAAEVVIMWVGRLAAAFAVMVMMDGAERERGVGLVRCSGRCGVNDAVTRFRLWLATVSTLHSRTCRIAGHVLGWRHFGAVQMLETVRSMGGRQGRFAFRYQWRW